MDCPGCSGRLVKERNSLFEYYSCRECHGVQIEQEALDLLYNHIKKHLNSDQEIPVTLVLSQDLAHRECSICHYTLYPFKAEDISFFHCLNCNVYWLESGMLAKIIDFFKMGKCFQKDIEQMNDSNPLHLLFSLINKSND